MISKKLRDDIMKLWDRFWAGGIANPLTAIEQITYLIFLKRLEDLDQGGANSSYASDEDQQYRWSYIKQMPSEERLNHLRGPVFDWLKRIKGAEERMRDAVFVIPNPNLLQAAIDIIDELFIPSRNQDTLGDIYEMLLSEIAEAGKNGQFRTPRQIIRAMCDLLDPQPGETVCDPACGTAGFLVNTHQHILKRYTSPDILRFEADGSPVDAIGDRLGPDWHETLGRDQLFGYDFDRTMVRLGWMNMIQHGLRDPHVEYANALGSRFNSHLVTNGGEVGEFDVMLANPPFTGNVDKQDVGDSLRGLGTTKTELLFVELIVQMLSYGGRAAVIVPEGFLFGSTNAHKNLRIRLLDENQLDAVISLPGGIFQPYTGVKTSILLFTKGGTTERVWFYEISADGYSMDAKRTQRSEDNDLWDMTLKFKLYMGQGLNRPSFLDDDSWAWWQSLAPSERSSHYLQPQLADRYLEADEEEVVRAQLVDRFDVESLVEPKDWTVTLTDLKDNGYNLSAGRYKPFALSTVEHDPPTQIVRELRDLEQQILAGLDSLLADLEERGMSLQELQLPKLWVQSTLGEQLIRSKKRIIPSDHPEREFFYIGLEHIEGNTGRLTNATPTFGRELKSTKNLFEPGDLLYGRLRPYLNKVHLADTTGICSTEIWVLRPSSTIDPEYAAYYLRSEAVLRRTSQLAAGANLPRVDSAAFDGLSIPIPPLPEQRRIVSLLRQSEALLSLRREADGRARAFLLSLFHEMFGLPTNLNWNWQTVPVREAGHVQLGRQRAPKYQTGKHARPYLRVANVFENRIDTSDLLWMDFDEKDFSTYRLQYGDVLLNEGQSTELVGRPAMWRDEVPGCCYQNTLLRFRADVSKTDPLFALGVFLTYLRNGDFAKLSAKTSSVAHLGANRFAALPFPLPPLALQQEFAATVAEAHTIDVRQKRQGSRIANLAESLQVQGFTGELTAGWREHHTEALGYAAGERDRLIAEGKMERRRELSGKYDLQLRLDEQSAEAQAPSPLRKDFIAALGPEQQRLVEIVSKYKGYFTAEHVSTESDLPLSTVRRGLGLLAATGLVLPVNIPRPVNGNVVFVPAYRTLRAEDKEITRYVDEEDIFSDRPV